MKVCITEKPSVANDIAKILGASHKQNGFFEGNGYCVTWTYGHLCTLKEPADYTEFWKSWNLSSLPMIPRKFGIKLIPIENYERQFNVIKTLIEKADEVINCGDAGQEGELIQRWVMQKAGNDKPVSRLWISSLTDQSIREGFAALKPAADFDNLYYAGLSRAIGDWLLGMNATRLYSLKYSSPGNVLSIGRVQTPTLALIVQRQKEIAEFKPENFWELKTLYRDVTFNATSGRFTDEQKAQEAVKAIEGSTFTVTGVQEKKGKEQPPRLFDLTSLQVECNKKFGWTADETLQLIQSLYEKKVTTYPRVDTTYLTDDIYPKVPDILRQMTPYAPLTGKILAARLPKPKRIFDNSKVTDHHAIIPTGQSPSGLQGNERPLYHLIALRFIAAFYPDCEFNQTIVSGKAADVDFRATGKVVTNPGWREVLEPNAAKPEANNSGSASSAEGQNPDNESDGDNRILPPFTVGESGPHKPSLLTRTTQPPKYYTEGTLLRAMETAGKTVDDEALREAMKENGIGRPSTRAAIIETLHKRRYVVRQRKNIVATQAGIDLIATINEELLKSAKLTGLWENKLRRIERGDYKATDFINELKEMITAIVGNVMNDSTVHKILIPDAAEKLAASSGKKSVSDSSATKPAAKRAPAIRKLEQIMCPLCGKGHILKGRTAYGCSEFRAGCSLRLDFSEYPADLTPGKLNAAIKKKFGK